MGSLEYDPVEYPTVAVVSRTELEYLADRVYAIGVSSLSTIGPEDKGDLVLASRVLRRLLTAYERANQRTLSALMLNGGQ